MVTLLAVSLFIVLAVPLGLAAQGLLFREAGEVRDPEWELYQQRYDEGAWHSEARTPAPGLLAAQEAAGGPVMRCTSLQTKRDRAVRSPSYERSRAMLTTPARYRIRVQGRLGSEWAAWFGGLTMSCEEPGQTIFAGQVIDQAALHGILNTIRDLGLPLLEVLRLPPEATTIVDP